MDLNEFTQKQESSRSVGRRCITCGLSDELLAQVTAGRRRTPKPVSFELISKWLSQHHDIKIHPNTIRNHFISGHHE